MDYEIDRDDGFIVTMSPGGGWDIHAPAPDVSDLPRELRHLVERRVGVRRRVQSLFYTGPERRGKNSSGRRRGAWFGWALDMEGVEVKVAREKVERLWH